MLRYYCLTGQCLSAVFKELVLADMKDSMNQRLEDVVGVGAAPFYLCQVGG